MIGHRSLCREILKKSLSAIMSLNAYLNRNPNP